MLYAAHRTGLLQDASPLVNNRDIQTTPLKTTIIIRRNLLTCLAGNYSEMLKLHEEKVRFSHSI
jgi:hypothetical protein